MVKPSDTMVVRRSTHADLLRLQQVVTNAGDAMLGIDNGGTWGSFTCSEIDALAALFTVAGRQDVAEFIVAEHAIGDEFDDDHYQGDDDE